MKNITLYRWYTRDNINELIDCIKWDSKGYSNYSNSLNFVQWYWKIIWEFEILDNTKIIEEDVLDRKPNVKIYDDICDSKWENGIKWLISNKWIFHYRIKNTILKLKKIHYVENDKLKNLWLLFLLNRKYSWKTQVEFSKSNNVPRVKISEYEQWKKLPTIDRILKIWWKIPIKQKIQIDWYSFSINIKEELSPI